jgi:hypothetical protein
LAASAAKLTSVNLIDNKNLERFPTTTFRPITSENALAFDEMHMCVVFDGIGFRGHRI